MIKIQMFLVNQIVIRQFLGLFRFFQIIIIKYLLFSIIQIFLSKSFGRKQYFRRCLAQRDAPANTDTGYPGPAIQSWLRGTKKSIPFSQKYRKNSEQFRRIQNKFRQNLDRIQTFLDRIQTFLDRIQMKFRLDLDEIQMKFRLIQMIFRRNLDEIQMKFR